MLTHSEPNHGGAVSSPARLGSSHGYRILGDTACLNAELAFARDFQSARSWALQLWACDAPYAGGALSGIKVAEAALDLSGAAALQPQHLYTETLARVPAGTRDFSMVLVLASGQAGVCDRVHDFANYPARERFCSPRLVGEICYSVDTDSVRLDVERLFNPRSDDNLSGTLALELWALQDVYAGGAFSGAPLGGVELGTLAGQQAHDHMALRLEFTPPPAAGRWNAVLMLREWTGAGYLTRDFRNFGPLQQLTVTSSAPLLPDPVAPGPNLARVEAEDSVSVSVTAAPQAAVLEVAVPEVAVPEVAEEVAAPVRNALVAVPVSIQQASLDELLQVKGLNRKLALEIIKARPFRAFEDLLKVRGIGDKMLRRLRAELKL